MAIRNGGAVADPALLNSFLLLTFADLKRFKFTYWFCFPVLQPPQHFRLASPASSLTDALGVELAAKVCCCHLVESACLGRSVADMHVTNHWRARQQRL
jgi:hypothetical protein